MARMEPMPDYGDLVDVQEWQDEWAFTICGPDDGSGYWATAAEYDRDVDCFGPKPDWATHVAWFNK